jgi:hypothetical protein
MKLPKINKEKPPSPSSASAQAATKPKKARIEEAYCRQRMQ